MALRLGVGDVFTVCKGAVDLCSRGIHDEPEDVRSIIAEMKLIRSHLKELEGQIGDEKAFVAARPDMWVPLSKELFAFIARGEKLINDSAPVLKRSLEPLHRDMISVNQILHECKRKPSVHVVDKVRFMILYKAKLEAFREKLPAHRESICVMKELLEDQTPTERRASTIRLCNLVESREGQQKQEAEYDRAQKEVVKMFEKRHSSIETDGHLSTAEMLEQLEDDLVANGASREQAGKHLLPLTKVLKLQPLSPSLSQTPDLQRPTFKLDVFKSRPGDVSQEIIYEDIAGVD